MKHLLLSLFLFCSSFSIAHADSLKAETFTLRNGLQCIVISNHKVPAVTHMVWYRAGSSQEPWGKSGIAHFLEHLMFKGTRTFKPGQFSSLIAKNGGNDNAFTSYDYTAYFQNIAIDRLPLVMRLEADRMQNLQLSPEEVLRERSVILEERSMRIDNEPRAQLNEQMDAALYLNHPYGRPVIGWRYEMEQLSLADAKAFYRQFYAPNNAFVIVAGDITAQQFRPLAEKYYGSLKAARLPASPALQEPPALAERRITIEDAKVQTPELRRYYLVPSPLPAQRIKNSISLMILAHALGGEGTGQLYQALVREKQLASAVDINYNGLTKGPSSFNITLTPQTGTSLATLEQALDHALARIVKEGITEEELSRAKNLLRAESIYARDGFQTLAFLFGHVLAAGFPLDYLEHWEQHVHAVTLKDVHNAASHVFKKEQSVTGLLHTSNK